MFKSSGCCWPGEQKRRVTQPSIFAHSCSWSKCYVVYPRCIRRGSNSEKPARFHRRSLRLFGGPGSVFKHEGQESKAHLGTICSFSSKVIDHEISNAERACTTGLSCVSWQVAPDHSVANTLSIESKASVDAEVDTFSPRSLSGCPAWLWQVSY